MTVPLPIVGLDVVRRYFPPMSTVRADGVNQNAVGHPEKTRLVVYSDDDGARLVTLSLDRHTDATAAGAAYGLAVEGSRAVESFTLLASPALGEQAFAGTVTQAGETHVGLGALSGRLVVGATVAGFDASDETVAHLTALAREQMTAAAAAPPK